MKGVYLFPDALSKADEASGQFVTTQDFESASLYIGKIAQFGRLTMETIIRNNRAELYSGTDYPLVLSHPIGRPILRNRYQLGSGYNPGPENLVLSTELVRNVWLVGEGFVPSYTVHRLGKAAHRLVSTFFEAEKRAWQELEDAYGAEHAVNLSEFDDK